MTDISTRVLSVLHEFEKAVERRFADEEQDAVEMLAYARGLIADSKETFPLFHWYARRLQENLSEGDLPGVVLHARKIAAGQELYMHSADFRSRHEPCFY